ncbi:MAG: hypothetical protein IJ046_01935, partial [Clostridia bacterium]|nr:hypothetical protein [Clostridia bacterium]
MILFLILRPLFVILFRSLPYKKRFGTLGGSNIPTNPFLKLFEGVETFSKKFPHPFSSLQALELLGLTLGEEPA